ncbi:DUF5711 family protein [Miniphocaeibacter halophilus]|uniref:Uncharacterized protein n=1 Tax=Miniphocaeibacter halophilus TaxID=2931922 RepID=A0AC61MS35_9FIRM|nr:DUF5711 family protein [Miniphocaeibacter halophilus]QQK08439.1 hypothetical protein JFY71_02570 [Miniphocaeibacter halophilus]
MKIFEKINKKLFGFILLFVLIIIGLVVLLFNLKTNNIGHMEKIPFEGDYSNIAILDKEIYLLKSNNLKSYDEIGKEKISVNVPVENGHLVGNNNTLVIYENKNLYILNSDGKIEESIKMKFEIANIEVKDKTIYVSGEKELVLIDLKGKQIDSIKTNSAITTSTMSENQKELIVTTIDLIDNVYKSNLYLKDLKNDTKINQSFVGEVIMFSEYIDKDRYLIISNKQAIILNDFEIQSKRRISDFKGAGVLKSNIYILEGDSLNIYDFDFKLINSIQLKGDYNNLFVSDNRVFLLSKNNYSEYIRGKADTVISVPDIEKIIKTENGLYLIHKDSVTNVDRQ